ncbi:putative ribonuclease H-like domain-containing protein [Tanacetum coccineum]
MLIQKNKEYHMLNVEDMMTNQFFVHNISAYASRGKYCCKRSFKYLPEDKQLHYELSGNTPTDSLMMITPTMVLFHPQTLLIAEEGGFLSQEEPKKVSQALVDESWVEAMQEELLQFKLQEVWVLCDLPEGKRVIGTKWVFRNKRDERVARIEAIRHFFGHHASFHGLHVYQMDSKVHLIWPTSQKKCKCQTASQFEEPAHPNKSSLPVKDFEDLIKRIKMSFHGELTFFLGLQVKQSNGGIFLSQDKYVKDILNKFDFRTIKPASTPIEAHKSLGKDEEGEDVDVHLYSPLKDSPFHLEAFSDSDYAGDNHDRRSTSGGCQYLGRRLVSWQCKKQTIVAISSTEAEYVAAASWFAQSSLDAKSTT